MKYHLDYMGWDPRFHLNPGAVFGTGELLWAEKLG